MGLTDIECMQIHLIVIDVIKLLSQNYVMVHISDMVSKYKPFFFFFRSLAQINSCLLHVASLISIKWYPGFTLICISLITKNVGHFCTCYFVHFGFCSGTYPFIYVLSICYEVCIFLHEL